MEKYNLDLIDLVALTFVTNYENCLEERCCTLGTLYNFQKYIQDLAKKQNIIIRFQLNRDMYRDLFVRESEYFIEGPNGPFLNKDITGEDLIKRYTGYLPLEVITLIFNK